MIIPLTPTVVRKIWGGKNLELLKNLPNGEGDPIGETWEISVHPEGPSFFQGKAFSLEHNESLPYLVKLIDTSQELSVQVHPDDVYARQHEKSLGKSECWIVLKAQQGAGIYLGFKPGVNKDIFIQGIKDKKNLSQYLNFYPVESGDFFYVPARTIHAIGPGITLAEVQQNSGVTYRVWDWNRVDSNGIARELHIEKSLDVINFDPEANTQEYFQLKKNLFIQQGQKDILNHEAFNLSVINLKKGDEIFLEIPTNTRLASVLVFEGSLSLNKVYISSYQSVIFRQEPSIQVKALENTSFIFVK